METSGDLARGELAGGPAVPKGGRVAPATRSGAIYPRMKPSVPHQTNLCADLFKLVTHTALLLIASRPGRCHGPTLFASVPGRATQPPFCSWSDAAGRRVDK